MSFWKVIFFLYLATLCVNADPCVTAEVRDASLRSPKNVYNAAQTSPRFCDNTLPEGWYKFEENGRPTDIPTVAPDLGSCNTLFPVYLNGELPLAPGQHVNIDACVRAPFAVCGVTIPIQVKTCTGFNVYYLKPVASCPTAYCFNIPLAQGPCPEGQSSETGLGPGCSVDFPDIDVIPVVVPSIAPGLGFFSLDKLVFECTADALNAAHFYDVVWFVNDVEVHRYTGLSSIGLAESARLLEEHWRPEFHMGMNVKCAIRARHSATGTPSPERPSTVFFAGIKIIDDTAIQIKEGEQKAVMFMTTVPIPCFAGFPCFLQLDVIKIGTSCSGERDSCNIQIQSNEWTAKHTFIITGNNDGLYGDQVAQFILKANPTVPGMETVWGELETAPIQVNIIDCDIQVAQSRCTIVNDPHLTTFDNKRFDVHIHGEFMLYRHKTLPYEVRGFFQKCSSNSVAHCVCGAAVRSGSQYFVWSRCEDSLYGNAIVAFQTSRINVYGCSARQLSVTTDNDARIYKVKLPSGMEVTIDTAGRSIYIVPSAADIAQSEGLCGNFNGDDTDEFIDPQGNPHSNVCERYLFGNPSIFCMVPTYSRKWMITHTVQSFYNGLMVLRLNQTLTAHCYCTNETDNNVINCENKPPDSCQAGFLADDVTAQHCTQLSGRRRKRSLPKLSEPIAIFPLQPSQPPPPPTTVWMNGWTKQRAEDHCRRAFGSLKFIEECRKIPNLQEERMIENCIADIALTGATEWTAVTTEAHKVQCLTEATKNTSLWKDEGQGPTVLQTILDKSCPGECSGNGACVKGVCECEPEWIGPGCNVNVDTPPNVALLLPFGGLCDLSEDNCKEVVVRGAVFVKSPSLRCRFSVVKGTGEGVTPVYVTPAIFRHSSEVVCRLPRGVVATSGIGYTVTASNQDDLYGDGKLFLPYHSGCFDCFISKNSVGFCRLQPGFCYLENTCVPEGSYSPSKQKCVTDVSGVWTNWIWRDFPSGYGDFEIREDFKPIPCGGIPPVKVEARIKGTTLSILTSSVDRLYLPGEQGLTQRVKAGPNSGFICKNKDQSGELCKDYEVRFLCRDERILIAKTDPMTQILTLRATGRGPQRELLLLEPQE